jgi:hypothetical protein
MWLVGVAVGVTVGVMVASGCSSSSTEYDFVQGTTPNTGAYVAKNACNALADCCEAGQAGEPGEEEYCAERTDCTAVFQVELDYGFCENFTYTGFVTTVLGVCACPGDDLDPPDAGADALSSHAFDAG